MPNFDKFYISSNEDISLENNIRWLNIFKNSLQENNEIIIEGEGIEELFQHFLEIHIMVNTILKLKH